MSRSKNYARRLYLASSSPRRVSILTEFSVPFIQIKNAFQEDAFFEQDAASLKKAIQECAVKKAFFSKDHFKGLILGVDTVVVFRDKIFGKPKTLKEAKEMLRHLSGNTHEVISGYCVLDTITDKKISGIDVSHVSFFPLADNDIDTYCGRYHPLDKAGSYAIQEVNKWFVSKVEGSYYNVVGLPIEKLLTVLAPYTLLNTGGE